MEGEAAEVSLSVFWGWWWWGAAAGVCVLHSGIFFRRFFRPSCLISDCQETKTAQKGPVKHIFSENTEIAPLLLCAFPLW